MPKQTLAWLQILALQTNPPFFSDFADALNHTHALAQPEPAWNGKGRILNPAAAYCRGSQPTGRAAAFPRTAAGLNSPFSAYKAAQRERGRSCRYFMLTDSMSAKFWLNFSVKTIGLLMIGQSSEYVKSATTD
ncbi:hypothetical protein NPIL_163621 [Nephila pilipes]|uniref:Uncharacterized protein n=1 Tax=Nephila pilipes TaxID=299642 RepID=A0A8X6MSA6_NEPPI|nr:hypothetical protein NPIL_163621 [Nephila pilipes]